MSTLFTIDVRTVSLLTDIDQVYRIIATEDEKPAGIFLVEFGTFPHANWLL
jgi:hypothetical protein